MTPHIWYWKLSEALRELDTGIWQIDLGFQGRKGIISAYLIRGNNGITLIETGPTSTLDNLRTALATININAADISSILLTHIHLDHAGAAGVLARETPGLKVYVHPFGAPHLIDPSKLVSSASRIYGDQMDSLWGEIAPIVEGQVVMYEDESAIKVAGRMLKVIFTPGHAWHHVALFDSKSGFLFTGDVAGIRMPGMAYVCPPTPPPDLDPHAWVESIRKLQQLQVKRLCLAHFGSFSDVDNHLAQIEPNLNQFVSIGESSVARDEDESRLTSRLHEHMAKGLDSSDPEMLASYELATPSYMAAMGLARYLKKRPESNVIKT